MTQQERPRNDIADEPPWLRAASEPVRRMYFYWKSKKPAPDKIPPRSAFDPAEVHDLLPYVSLIDVVPDERRYVYRLVGTYDVRVRGSDPTGKSVKEAYFGPSLENVLGCYDQVVNTCAPNYDNEPFQAPGGRYIDDETLFLPFADDGQTVNKILVFGTTTDTLR